MLANGYKYLACLLIVLALGAVNWGIYQKQQLLQQGEIIRLALAPVDPRSLMQGDYMALNYAIATQMRGACYQDKVEPCGAARGQLVIELDNKQLATSARFADDKPLAANQHYLRYHQRADNLQVGTNAYFFQEGQADKFAQAKYGEFRVAKDGTALLTQLLDENMQPIAR